MSTKAANTKAKNAKDWARTRRVRRGGSSDSERARGLCRRLMHAGDVKGAAAAALLGERLERLERAAQKRATASPRPPPPRPAPPPPPPAYFEEEPASAEDRSSYEPRNWRNVGWR